jgi:hypothetical protein
MAETATTLASVFKEGWTSNRMQKQFEDAAGPLTRIESVKGSMIGKQAQVPILKYNAGGYTSFGSAGGSFNTYNNLGVDQAVYTLVNHGMPISIEFSALNQGSGNAASVIATQDLVIEQALSEMRKQATRQLVTNGDGIVAQCASGGASTTVSLTASPSGTAWGYDAIQRGWLHVNGIYDIGTTADTDSLVTATTLTALAESATAPTVTQGTSITTVAGTHNVYIANPNSATAANPETNGLRNIVNSTGALGGLNPATAGQESWAASSRDTSTTVFSLDLALSLDRAVKQKTGKAYSNIWTSYKQQANFYSLLQNQARYTGDLSLGAGEVAGVTWSGMKVEAFPDILDSDWFALNLEDFVRVHGKFDKPTWASEIEGSGGSTRWAQNATNFVDAVFYAYNIGVQRRNSLAGATALTA